MTPTGTSSTITVQSQQRMRPTTATGNKVSCQLAQCSLSVKINLSITRFALHGGEELPGAGLATYTGAYAGDLAPHSRVH